MAFASSSSAPFFICGFIQACLTLSLTTAAGAEPTAATATAPAAHPTTAPATRPASRPAEVPLRPYPAQRPDAARPVDFKVTAIDGTEVDLRSYEGYVILFVNVASNCGLTPQYAGLQKLYDRYHDYKFVILGFPANDFAHQEPGTNEQIKAFATGRYGVTFPLMSKIAVKGQNQHPLYAFLTEKGTAGGLAGPVDWNFAKFLIGKDGKVAARFISRTAPTDPKLLSTIETALGLTPEQVAALPPVPATRPATAPATKPVEAARPSTP